MFRRPQKREEQDEEKKLLVFLVKKMRKKKRKRKPTELYSENINLWQGTCEYCCTPIIRSKQLNFAVLIRTFVLRLHVHSKHNLDYEHLMYYEVPLCGML